MLPQLLLNYTLHCSPGPPVAGACDYRTVLSNLSAGKKSGGIAGIKASLLRASSAACQEPYGRDALKCPLHNRLHLQTTTGCGEHCLLPSIINDWLGYARQPDTSLLQSGRFPREFLLVFAHWLQNRG